MLSVTTPPSVASMSAAPPVVVLSLTTPPFVASMSAATPLVILSLTTSPVAVLAVAELPAPSAVMPAVPRRHRHRRNRAGCW